MQAIPPLPTLGASLKAIRKSAGMTLHQVCDIAGVSPTYLSRVENGHADPTSDWVSYVIVAIGSFLMERDKEQAA